MMAFDLDAIDCLSGLDASWAQRVVLTACYYPAWNSGRDTKNLSLLE